MPDIPNRDGLERRLARELGKLMGAQGTQLLEQLGDPPNIDNVSPDFWDGTGHDLMEALRRFFETVYLDSARRAMDDVGVGVDWGLVNESAVVWARTYSFDLVEEINNTSRRVLQEAIAGYFEEPMSIGDLKKRLAQAFGVVRAEMIATTEITRASAQGELAVAAEIAKEGVELMPIWETNNDDLVCPICGPRHGKRQGDGWQEPPPAHRRCRCWLRHEVVTQ